MARGGQSRKEEEDKAKSQQHDKTQDLTVRSKEEFIRMPCYQFLRRANAFHSTERQPPRDDGIHSPQLPVLPTRGSLSLDTESIRSRSRRSDEARLSHENRTSAFRSCNLGLLPLPNQTSTGVIQYSRFDYMAYLLMVFLPSMNLAKQMAKSRTWAFITACW